MPTRSGWHRKNPTSPAAQARKAEYNSRHYKQARAIVKQQVDRGEARCWRCHQPIPPGTPWHCGHDDWNRNIIRGAEHPTCNLKAAARKGNRIVNGRRRTTALPM